MHIDAKIVLEIGRIPGFLNIKIVKGHGLAPCKFLDVVVPRIRPADRRRQLDKDRHHAVFLADADKAPDFFQSLLRDSFGRLPPFPHIIPGRKRLLFVVKKISLVDVVRFVPLRKFVKIVSFQVLPAIMEGKGREKKIRAVHRHLFGRIQAIHVEHGDLRLLTLQSRIQKVVDLPHRLPRDARGVGCIPVLLK